MPVHTLRIESTSRWCALEIRSTGTWARAPGRRLSYQASGGGLHAATLDVDDRAVRLEQHAGLRSEVVLVIQLATVEDRVLLNTSKAPDGVLRVASSVDAGANDGQAGDANARDILLYLEVVPSDDAHPARPGPTRG